MESVSAEDRRRMARQAAALQALDTQESGDEDQRAPMVRASGGVLTVEDVIVHKLIAGRPRDIDDIRSIRATGIALDHHYVEDNARQWDVFSRWSDLLKER